MSDLFNGFYYIFTGKSTSKADKFDNLHLMKILSTPLTHKSPGIRTKRPEQEQNLQTKKGAISRPWRMNFGRKSFSPARNPIIIPPLRTGKKNSAFWGYPTNKQTNPQSVFNNLTTILSNDQCGRLKATV